VIRIFLAKKRQAGMNFAQARRTGERRWFAAFLGLRLVLFRSNDRRRTDAAAEAAIVFERRVTFGYMGSIWIANEEGATFSG